MEYMVAEKFKSLQGEGLYAGTPMAFIRFVGCSVGKRICQHCDTDFDRTLTWRGGGVYTAEQLVEWAGDHEHICLTGGEPLDQDLEPILAEAHADHVLHVETSGTKSLSMFSEGNVYVCVSPKPGWLEESVKAADEIKVIVPGLGEINNAIYDVAVKKGIESGRYPGTEAAWKLVPLDFRWPELSDAIRWTQMGKVVYLQPRNGKFDIDQNNLRYVQDLLMEHPTLRLSVQMHKILKVQ